MQNVNKNLLGELLGNFGAINFISTYVHIIENNTYLPSYYYLLWNALYFSGFAARELCARINHATPKVIIAANCGIEPNKIVRYLKKKILLKKK